MKLHLPKGLRKAVIACLTLSASFAVQAYGNDEEIRPDGLSGGKESGMYRIRGSYDNWDGENFTYYSGSVYLGLELDEEDTQGPDGTQLAVDCVGTSTTDTQVVLTDAAGMYPGSISRHGTQWSRFAGYLAGSNISSELRSSSLIIRDIADNVSISGWNVGGSGQISNGTHLHVNASYGMPTFIRVGTTSVSIEANKGKDFYVFGVDGVTLADSRNKIQVVNNGYPTTYDGSVSAGPLSIVGGNLTNTVLSAAGGHATQSIVSNGSHVNIGGGRITGHVIGGSAVISFRNKYFFDAYREEYSMTEAQYEEALRFANAHNAFDLWVAESHVTMTGGKMEKGWAHGQNGSHVTNYYSYDSNGDILKDNEGRPIFKNGVNNTMVPRIVGGNLLHIADTYGEFGTSYLNSVDIYDPAEGWVEKVPAFGIGNTHVEISGNSEVYDVIGGSWSLIDIPDMVSGRVDMSKVVQQPRYITDEDYLSALHQYADGDLQRDVRQGNTNVTLRDQVVVKGDVIAAGIQSGRTALITESTRITLGAQVRFEKDLTKYDPVTNKTVDVTNMWEINGSHSIIDGGYMLIDPPMGGVFNYYNEGAFVTWKVPIPVYSLKYGDMLAEAGIDWKTANWDELFDMSSIEKKGYWHLAGFEEGGFGWDDADYRVYSDHPYVHGERTLALDEAAEYHDSLKDAYFINFDQVNVVKGASATIGSLVIDDNQTFADDGKAPDSENWSETPYDNDVPTAYRERNLTTISGGGELRMWVGFDMEVWYWEAKDYEELDDEALQSMPDGTVVESNLGRKKYLSAVYDPEVLNNTYIAVKGFEDGALSAADRNKFCELSKNTILHLLPRQDEKGQGNNAVSFAYRMDAYNGGVLHVDVAPKYGRNTMYVLNELNIHDEGYLKMSTNLTSDMELQAHAALHKAPKDTQASAPGSVRELMTDWDSLQTVTFNKGYFDLRIRNADRSLYKDELYVVLIDRVTGNNVGTTTESRNYMITERTKEELRLWFGDDYDWAHDLTDLNEWDKHHVWIGVEKVVDGRETDGLSGADLLEEDRKGHEDDWAMVIRAKKVSEEKEETSYHRFRHLHTPNGRAGSELLDEHFDNPTDDPNDVRKKITERIVDLNSEERFEESDRLEAAVAGSSYSVLGAAAADDVVRQLRSIRNRAAKGLDQELMAVKQRYENGGKAGLTLHEYPEAVPAKQVSFWVSAESAYNTVGERSTDPGFRLSSWGGSVGAAYSPSNEMQVGLALSAMYGDLTSKGPDSLKGDMDTTYLSAFARIDSGKWSHCFIGTLGLVEMEGTRSVDLGGDYGGYSTHYDTEGYALGLMYELSYTLGGNRDKTSLYQAVANLAWRHVQMDGFTEQGDSAAELRIGDQSMDSLILGAGMRGQWLVGGDMLNRGSQLELRLLAKGYTGDLLRNRVSVGFSDREFASSVRSRKQGALGLELGAGYTLPLDSGTGTYAHSLFLDMSAEVRRAGDDLNATLGYSVSF